MTADGAALLAAAIRSAVLAKAPRRTVQAIASAVTGVVLRSGNDVPRPAAPVRESTHADEAADDSSLLAALRASRKAQRIRKKARRREAKLAASSIGANSIVPVGGNAGSAGTEACVAAAETAPIAMPPPLPPSDERQRSK